MDFIKGISLFANVGIAETYLKDIGIDIVLANELLKERADFYSHLYPDVEMICGDITEDAIRTELVEKALQKNVDFLIATPPCQGMSRHGKRETLDPRNFLIYYAIDVIKRLKPKYILLENVPQLLTTKIKVDNKLVLIPDYIKKELSNLYVFGNEDLYNSSDYGVPQSRSRCLYKLVRKDVGLVWGEPKKEKRINMEEAIGHLPSIDPLIREKDKRTFFPDYEKKKVEGLKISKWHYPPTHSWNHVLWMTHTPSGKTAFYNDKFYPQKANGEKIKGRLSCYRRYSWDKPANTITQNNGVISSACCVHPGRKNEKENTYSDARVLTIYELLIVSSLPTDWNIPEWASDKLIRNVIGEGIPPKMVKAIAVELINSLNNKI